MIPRRAIVSDEPSGNWVIYTECTDGVGSWQILRCESGILWKTHGILSSR